MTLKPFWPRIKKNATDKLNWLSLVSGLSLVFAYAPFSLWWLPFIALPLWFTSLSKVNDKTAGKQAFIFSFAWFASGLSWVHVSIAQFGGMPLIASVSLMVLLVGYLAIYPSLACYWAVKLEKKLSHRLYKSDKANSLLLLPLFWFIADIARGIFLTGFPWLSLGYSQINSPLAAFAPLIGEQGLSLLIICLSLAIAHIIQAITVSKQRPLIATSLIIVTLVSCYALHGRQWVAPTAKQVSVALVQGNIAQDLKWEPEQEWPNAMTYLGMSRQHLDADLIIWPESAITGLEPMQWVQEFLSLANHTAAINSSAIVTGILNYDVKTKAYYNGLIVLGNYQDQATAAQKQQKKPINSEGDYHYGTGNRYYKNHLLPIGEFVPFQEWLAPLAPLFNLPMSSFSRGDYIQANIKANGINLLPLICFEIAFPEQLAANLTSTTDVIITVSNDAWFGRSHGPHQHLDIARMRALEFGKPVLRATNTGITAVIDHLGQIQTEIPQFQQQVLQDTIVLTTGTTPYARWHALLPWLVIAFYLVAAICYSFVPLASLKRTK